MTDSISPKHWVIVLLYCLTLSVLAVNMPCRLEMRETPRGSPAFLPGSSAGPVNVLWHAGGNDLQCLIVQFFQTDKHNSRRICLYFWL